MDFKKESFKINGESLLKKVKELIEEGNVRKITISDKTGKELMDIIALHCDFPIYRISGLLLNMELKGVIRPLPGKIFEAI